MQNRIFHCRQVAKVTAPIMAALVFGFVCGQGDARAQTADDDASSRTFKFDYAGKINGLNQGDQVRLWLPLAESNRNQIVEHDLSRLPNFVSAKKTTESVYGNKMIYQAWTSENDTAVPFAISYTVTRNEVNGLKSVSGDPLKDADRLRYLNPNRMVPIAGRPLEVLQGVEIPVKPIQAARALYHSVEGHMTYDKSKPGYGRGDVLWACDSKTGNCTDFHSLFISFARNRKIPAYFEIGFPIPRERGQGKIGGYHCWAWFHVDDRGWIPVDISEADKQPKLKEYFFGNLTEDRIAFSKGRDLILEPKQAGEPLNYFVYPYVEVNGKVWPKEKIELEFRYKDVESR